MADASKYTMNLTVNADEYRGVILGLDLLDKQTRGRIIIFGDSNLWIHQMRGYIESKALGLQLLHHKEKQILQS